MCLYPKLVKNPKYRVNKKNGGEVPEVKDTRVLYVPVGCQECMECRKQKAAQWKVRLLEDIKVNRECQFITLTFSDEQIANISEGKDINGKQVTKPIEGLEGYDLDNEIATRAMRYFLERWRKKHGKSLRHWCSTEIGGHGSENIHMHGIVWTKDMDALQEIWAYGYVWSGEERGTSYVNESTVGYITKYLNKIDKKHRGYKSKVLASAGIGANYVRTTEAGKHKYVKGKTKESYRASNGKLAALPIYYRNKIYSEEEREQLWLEKLDKEIRYVGGEKIRVGKGEEEYNKALKYYRKLNKEFGYGGEVISEERYLYEQQKRNLAVLTRIEKGKSKRKRRSEQLEEYKYG